MKKYIAVLLAALTVLMAGCARDTAPETTAATQPPVVEIPFETEADARPYVGVELNFWSALAEDDAAAQVMVQAAEVFEKKTGAQVHFTWQAEAVSDASDADIFQTDIVSLADLACAVDLTEQAAAAEYELSSFMVLRQLVTDSCGTLNGIPFTPRLEGLYYNRQAFEDCGIMEMPGSWEHFLALCSDLEESGYRSLTLNTEDGAKAVQLHLESALGTKRLAELLAEDQLSEDGAAVEACQQLIAFAAEDYVLRGDYPEGQNKMGLSNAAMIVGGNEMLREIEKATLTEISWGVMGWPVGGAAYADCDVLAVHSSCENVQAAFDFIELLTTGEFDQLRADVTEGFPADPNNVSPIAGGVETMAAARPASADTENQGYVDLAARLWDGKYQKGEILAAAVEQLSAD